MCLWSDLHVHVLAVRALHSRLGDKETPIMTKAHKQRKPAKRKLLIYLKCMSPLIWCQAINKMK